MKKGFTLIELLVVIAIISLLSSVVLAGLKSVRTKASAARIAGDIRTVVPMMKLWMEDNGCPMNASGSCIDNQPLATTQDVDLASIYSANGKNFKSYFSAGTEVFNSANTDIDYQLAVSGDTLTGDCNIGGVYLMVYHVPTAVYEILESWYDGTSAANMYGNTAKNCGLIKAPFITQGMAANDPNSTIYVQMYKNQHINQ